MTDILWNQYPASNWVDATPVGNGIIGGMVFGNLYDDTVVLNHEQLYTKAQTMEIPDVSAHLPVVRKMIEEGKYQEANDYYADVLKKLGYQANMGKYMPALDLQIVQPIGDEFEAYRRELNLEEGICSVKWAIHGKRFARNYYVSSDKNVFVTEFEAEEPLEEIKLALRQRDPLDSKDNAGNLIPPHTQVDIRVVDGNYIYFTGKSAGDINYGAILKVVCDECRTANDSNISGAAGASPVAILRYDHLVCSGSRITVLVDVFPGDKKSDFTHSRKKLDRLELDTLRQRHVKKFSRMYNSCRFDVAKDPTAGQCNEKVLLDSYNRDTEFSNIVKLAKFGRYLFVASSMNCKLPANLQGIWNGAYTPAWSCGFFNNENVEMSYWQALPGNLCDSMLPLFDLYERFMDDYRENARKLYGCRGILVPLFMDNQCGLKKGVTPHVLYWTGGSGWIAAMFFNYYRYTGDEKFLLERAYPFMKEAFDFYDDYTVVKDGKLQYYPSQSPENCPLGDFEGAGFLRMGLNATMDYAISKELASNLLYIQENFLHDAQEITRLQTFLSRIPPYEINEDGAVREWMHENLRDNYKHRHISHIYPLFPGNEITRESDPEIFKAMGVALDKRMTIGLRAQSGWSLAHIANAYARLNEGDEALHCLRDVFRFCIRPNYLTLHNDWRKMGSTLRNTLSGRDPVFQIDSNFGVTAAVLEMLCYSNDKQLKIFPAMPEEWDRGSFKGILAWDGLQLSARWNGKGATVTIVPRRDCIKDVSISGYTFEDGTQNARITFRTGEKVVLTCVK